MNTAAVTTASVNMALAPRDMGREAVVEEVKVTTDSQSYPPIIVVKCHAYYCTMYYVLSTGIKKEYNDGSN